MASESASNDGVVAKTVIVEEIHASGALPSSQVCLLENVLTQSESLDLLQELTTSLPWKTETDAFGKQTRQTCYYGDDAECCVLLCRLGLASPAMAFYPATIARRGRVGTAT